MATTTLNSNDQEFNAEHLAGQYMTFKLGDENFGIEILKVQEIIGLMKITAVPRTPDYIRGVINLRGKVISVIDLRTKFKMDQKEDTEKTVIIVVHLNTASDDVILGLVVDEVSEVLDVPLQAMEAVPNFDNGVETDYLSALGKVGNLVVMLLDVDRMLSDADFALKQSS